MTTTPQRGRGMVDRDQRRFGSARARIGALAVLLGLGTAGATAAPASAGTWGRVACMHADQSPAPSEGWSTTAAGPSAAMAASSALCAPGLPMHAALRSQQAVLGGTSASLVYTPPPGSTLVGGSLLVALAAYGYDAFRLSNVSNAAVYTPAYVHDPTNVTQQCAMTLNRYPCQFSGVVSLPAGRGGNLYVVARCDGLYYCSSGDQRGVWAAAAVGWAHLLLSSSSLPTASDFAGSLLDPNAHGTAGLTFTAADPDGPGIHRATVSIDGKPVYSATPNTNGGRCVPVGSDPASGALMWDYQQPCPKSQPVHVAVDTTLLPDGEHELKVTLLTAAANTATVLARTITTNNRTTISSTLTSDPPPDPDYTIVLDPGTQALRSGVRRAFSRSALTLSGSLRTSAGLPAPGVAMTLLAQNGRQGTAVAVARTVTDAAGHWVLTAPRGPSRMLTIAYGSTRKPGVTISQTVRAGLTLSVRPLGQGRLRFTGRLRVAPLGAPRPLVVIQARNGRRWQNVGRNVRVSPTGRFALTYDGGRRILGGSYAFRAVAPATRLFSAGVSPIRRVVAR
jgi:hypothetical protein